MWKNVPCVAKCPACDSELGISKRLDFYHPDGDINSDVYYCEDKCPLLYSHMTVSDSCHAKNGMILDRQIYIPINENIFRMTIAYYKSNIRVQKCKLKGDKYNKNDYHDFPLFNINYKDKDSIVLKVMSMLVFV